MQIKQANGPATFSHLFDVAFQLENKIEDPYSIPVSELLDAVQKRVDYLRNHQDECRVGEAFGHCDSYPVHHIYVQDPKPIEHINVTLSLIPSELKVPPAHVGVPKGISWVNPQGTFYCRCGRHHSRGPINGVNAYRCCHCGDTTVITKKQTASEVLNS